MFNVEKKIELLAPAKDKDTAKAAIDAGADAVYIGYIKFGARKQAGNSLEDIKEVVEYADLFRAKVYVTLNTIYKDEELPVVEKTIHDLYKIGVSAIIIQDMSILRMNLPPIKLFASTQCHNNTLEKIKFLNETGFERVILPREFSLDEIKNITSNTDIDVETFVHGALCVSYSGQCYLSYAIGGRSANRGECAQPCRKKYTVTSNDGKIIAKNKYLLSLKDFNLSERLEDLILAGVTSFKIEGRLKDSGYVKNVVAYYRKKLDTVLAKLKMQKSSIGKSFPEFEPNPEKSFNRGFTEFFADGIRKNFCTKNYVKSLGELVGTVNKTGKNYFTISGKKLNNGDGICFFDEKNELVGTLIQKVEQDKIFPQKMDFIKNNIKIYRNFDNEFSKQLTKPIKRKIEIDCTFKMSENEIELTFSDTENNIASKKVNNNFEKAKNQEKALETIKNQIAKTGNTEFTVKNINVDTNNVFFIRAGVLNELRREAIELLQTIRKNNLKREKRTKEIQKINYPMKTLDYSANIYNEEAKKFYTERGAFVDENAAETLSELRDKTLMTTKHCIKYTLGLCKKHFKNVKNYKEPLLLIDEMNKKYILYFNCKKCEMHVNANNCK